LYEKNIMQVWFKFKVTYYFNLTCKSYRLNRRKET